MIRERVMTNGLYKGVALVVALAIWATTLQSRKDALVTRNVGVEIALSPKQKMVNKVNRTVTVKLAGPRAVIKKLNHEPLIVSKNILNLQAGLNRVTINAEDLNIPKGIKVISITPNEIDLDIKEVDNNEKE
jgi:YbbR domain-containing protein